MPTLKAGQNVVLRKEPPPPATYHHIYVDMPGTTGYVDLDEIAEPSSPASGSVRVFIDSGDGLPKAKDSGGTVHDLAGAHPRLLAHAEHTSSLNVTATTEAGADTVVTAPELTFDGSTPILVEFFAGAMRPDSAAAGRSIALWLFDGSSSIGRLCIMFGAAAAADVDPVKVGTRLTPSSGAHTYSVRASVSAGTGAITAGAGGTATQFPAYIRVMTDPDPA